MEEKELIESQYIEDDEQPDKINDFLEWGLYGYDPNGEYEILNMLYTDKVPEGYVSPRVQINCFKNRFLYEFDDMDMENQLKIVKKLYDKQILFRATYSGSKSIHMIIVVEDEPDNMDEYKFLWHYINDQLELHGADNRCSENSRLTRRPGMFHRLTKEKFLSVKDKVLFMVDKLNVNVKFDKEDILVEQKLLLEPKNIFKINWREAYQEKLLKLELELKQRQAEYEAQMEKFKDVERDPKKFLENYTSKHNIVFMDGFKHVAAASIASAYFTAGFTDVEYLQNWVKTECMSDDKTIWCNLGKLK